MKKFKVLIKKLNYPRETWGEITIDITEVIINKMQEEIP